MLRVRLAGGLRLEVDGREVPPPRSRRARAVLAWLAANPGAHARADVAARFWPDVLDESARTSLRAALTELRAALGAGAGHLVATRDTVALDGAWVDLREFQERLDAGRTAEAVDLVEGELLTGFEGEWVDELRSAHTQRLGEALEAVAQAAERAGDHAEAARRTRAAVALDPLAEGPNRRLIERLAAAGDRAAALAAYGRLADRLRQTLGIPPSPATRELVERLREGVAEPAETARPVALTTPDEHPFVGRDRELERMRAAWTATLRDGGRRLLLLAGEPGIGKSRLSLRFAGEALDADAAVVVVGRCSEEPLRPYEPFAEIAEQLGRDFDALVGDTHPAAEDPGARHRLFAAFEALLASAGSGRPLLLVADDLHWADRPTLLLLRFLLRGSRAAPMLIVGTYRDTDLGRSTPLTGALAELRRERGADSLTLRGLAPPEVDELAHAWLGGGADPGLTEELHARTGGNAFFVEEVLRAIAEERDEPLPESVRHAVAVRRNRLGDEAEALAGVAAVLGQEMDSELLLAVAGIDAEVAERALDELVGAHLVRAAGPARLEFTHAVVRDAVYQDLNPLRRARLHRRAAAALRERSEERHVEQIAHHLATAGDGAAAGFLRRAGERAVAMLAYEEAAEHFARALEAASDEETGPLLLACGDALLRAGEPERARACFEAAARLARRTADHALLARAALGACGLGVAIIDVDERRVALLEEALETVGDRDAVLRSQLLARLAVELYYAPSRDRSESLSAEAVAVAEASGDPHALATALNSRHVALWRPDRLEERLRTADAMIETARAAGSGELELQGRNWRVVDLWELGDITGWRTEVARHGALAHELQLPAFAWYTPLWEAVDALHAGHFEELPGLRRRAREAGDRAGDPNAELFDEVLAFAEVVVREDWEALNVSFLREKIDSSPAGFSYLPSYVWYLALAGRLDEAREQMHVMSADGFRGVAFDANWPSAMGECAEAVLLLEDTGAAAALYELLLPYSGRCLTAGRAIASYGAADRTLGGLALVLGRTEEAVAHLRAAERLNAAMGFVPWLERTRRLLRRACPS